ncbi:SseB family protein, partial [Brevibacterium paucivorans]
DPRVTAALEAATANPFDPAAHIGVVEALKNSRVYAPILPEALSKSVGEHGLMVDNSSDMAMVRLSSEDGREATPCFTAIPLIASVGAGPGSQRIVTGGPELAIVLTLDGEPDFSAFQARL